MEVLEKRLLILYGSQTGTAQEVAERMWREGKLRHFTGPVLAMDDYVVSQLIDEAVVIFVCSTTGQGEEPDNMKSFWKFLLRRNLPPSSLQNVRFAVLGLGDSSYVKFNFVAKRLTRRLLQLGGKLIVNTGLADDQHDLGADAVVEPWIKELWEVLAAPYTSTENIDITVSLCPPRWNVVVLPAGAVAKTASWGDGTSQVTVVENNRTTAPSHFQNVRLIKFRAPELSYEPGDVLSVRPRNLPASVDVLLGMLRDNTVADLGPDTVVQVEAAHANMPVPRFLCQPITLLQCAEEYWDLSGAPQRYVFRLLSHFTTSELERDKCVELCSAEGQEELFSYCHRPRRTVLEVLADFPHATPHIPLCYWFELLRPIRPRAFSIASSPAAHIGEVHILVAVVKYFTILVAPRLGLCSNWLASLSAGTTIAVSIRKGSLRFPSPSALAVPSVMIGPGTGVAPFRSFMQECMAHATASADSLYLFFGCRNEHGDFHFQDEWRDLEREKQLTLFCAFSRDQDHKVYVQHEMERVADVLWDVVAKRNGCVFLAGSSKNMPQGVREALTDTVFRREGKMSTEEAQEYLDSLEKSGRFQSETWS